MSVWQSLTGCQAARGAIAQTHFPWTAGKTTKRESRMVDPIHSLAFSIEANRGVYAVLLGSGVSKAARIPTGWEITLDLVRKLAALYGEHVNLTRSSGMRPSSGKEQTTPTCLTYLSRRPPSGNSYCALTGNRTRWNVRRARSSQLRRTVQ